MRCIGSRVKDAELWILMWEDLHPEGMLVEVAHDKAHRSKKEMQ